MITTYYLHPNIFDPFDDAEVDIRPVVGETVTCGGFPYRVVKESWFLSDRGPMAAIVPTNYMGEIPPPTAAELRRAEEKKILMEREGCRRKE